MPKSDVIAPLLARVCRTHHWVRKGPHPSHINEPLADHDIEQHLGGGYARGVCPMAPGERTTRCAVLDMDSHKGDVPWEQMLEKALEIVAALAEANLYAVAFRSSGGQGIHLYLLWREPQDAYSVREALRIALGKAGLASGTGGVAKGEVEIFPKQDSVPADGFGSMFILPLNGKSCALAGGSFGPPDIPPELIQWRASDPVTVRERPAPPPTSTVVPAELATLKSALDAIPNSATQELPYDDWRNVCFAAHSAAGDAALPLVHEFSARSSKYDPDFLDNRVWPYINSERPTTITVRSLYALASQHGWVDPTIADDFQVTLPPSNDTLTPTAGQSQSGGGTRYQPLTIGDFTMTENPDWIVKDVLAQGALAMIFGESGSGKSFWALDLACAIARGGEWCGKKVKQGRVAYLVAEGAAGFRKRVRAYVETNDAWGVDMGFITDTLRLNEASDVKALIASLTNFGPLSVIFLDTLAAVTPGTNENSGEDMGAVLYHCEQINRVTGALVVLIHHSGKDSTKGARGWSGVRAAVDTEIEITRCDDDRSAQVTKSKDGVDSIELPFKLRQVTVGHDEDGEPITSCVVDHVATRSQVDRGRRVKKGVVEKLVQRAALDLAALDGSDLTVSQVIDHAVNQMPFDAGSGKRDRRREVVLRALEMLAGRGILQVDGGRVTVVSGD